MNIPRNITGSDMIVTIETPLMNNNIIPMIDNKEPEMISILAVILFRFTTLNFWVID